MLDTGKRCHYCCHQKGNDMASLRKKDRSPYWFACFTMPDGSRTQRSTGTTDRRKAQCVANAWEDAALAGRQRRLTENHARKVVSDIFAMVNRESLPSANVKDFLATWLQRKEIEAGEHTHLRYASAAEQFLDYLAPRGTDDVAQITAKDFTGFRDALAKRVTANTVNVTLKILRSAFNQAYRDGLVEHNEAARVSLLKRTDKFERRPFTLEEIKRILEVADDEWRGLVLFGLYSGQRLGDLATLTWQNIDLARQEMRLTTEKTGRRQIIPLAKPVIRYLEGAPAGDNPAQPLFPRAYEAATDGTTSGRNSKQFHSLLVQAGLLKPRTHKSTGKGRSARREQNEISFHALRHTSTSWLKSVGVSDALAMDLIGHDSSIVSANYTHLSEDVKRAAIEKLPDVTQ